MHARLFTALLIVLAACGADAPPLPLMVGDVSVSGRARLHYRVVGAGHDTLIVLHGGPGLHSRYLQDAFDLLAPNRTVIYYDQRGRGASDAEFDSTRFTAAQDIADLDSLRRFFHIDRVTLAGHHWGAVLAALYAKEYPEHVARLLLVSPSFPHARYLFWEATLTHDQKAASAYLSALSDSADVKDPAAFCRQFWGFLFSPSEITADLVRRLGSEMCEAPPATLRHSWLINRYVASSLHGLNLRDTLAAVTVPTLIVRGIVDTAITEGTRAWVRWTPNARELVLPTPGVFPWLGGPAKFARVTGAFLDGKWPDGSQAASIANLKGGK